MKSLRVQREPSNEARPPSGLVALAYDAVGDEKAWPRFLESLGLELGGRSLVLVLHHAGETFYASTRAPRDGVSTMNPAAVFGERSLSARGFLVGHVLHLPSDVGPRGELLEDRDELHERLRSGAAASAVELFGAQRDRWSPVELDLARALAPHFHRASALHLKVSRKDTMIDALTGILDALQLGVILLGARANVRYVNPAGQRLLRRKDTLSIEKGRLTASADAVLSRAVRLAAASGASRPPIGPKLLSFGEGASSLFLWLLPLRPGLCLGALTAPGRRRFAENPAHLREVFGITRKEAEVFRLFARSKTAEDIAARLGVQPSTVRLHLKRVLAKTGTHRQIELLHRLVDLLPEVVM